MTPSAPRKSYRIIGTMSLGAFFLLSLVHCSPGFKPIERRQTRSISSTFIISDPSQIPTPTPAATATPPQQPTATPAPSTPPPTPSTPPPTPGATPTPLPAFVTGYNEGWFGGNFGTDLTTNFDLNYINKVFSDIRNSGGYVVRIWLFEGAEGLILGADAPATQGIQPVMLENLSKLLAAARSLGLRVYFTSLEGNTMTQVPSQHDFFYNLLNNKYGEGDAFFQNALAPVLRVLNANQDAVYGLDLINEIEAPIRRGMWSDPIVGARTFVARSVLLVKTVSPWLRVTVTAGWDSAAADISSGLLSGLGLDFYDLHVYSDNGSFSGASGVCSRAQADHVPVILGEFGQKSKVEDDNLQAYATAMFLANARSLCFSAAFAWRFDSTEPYMHIQRSDGTLRPAAQFIKAHSGY